MRKHLLPHAYRRVCQSVLQIYLVLLTQIRLFTCLRYCFQLSNPVLYPDEQWHITISVVRKHFHLLRILDEKDFLNELGLLNDAVNYYYISVLWNEWMIMERWWKDTERGKLKYSGKRPLSRQLQPQQIRQGVTCDRSQASAAKAQRLTSWIEVRPTTETTYEVFPTELPIFGKVARCRPTPWIQF